MDSFIANTVQKMSLLVITRLLSRSTDGTMLEKIGRTNFTEPPVSHSEINTTLVLMWVEHLGAPTWMIST